MQIFFKSFIYFFSNIFARKSYDIIFYYPQHFNRGKKSENKYFRNLINSCKQSNITYIVFEEPDFYSNCKRDSSTIPFDLIFYLIVILRKLLHLGINVREKDNKIGKFLSQTFFRSISFKNLVTISQSMVNIFRGIDSTCAIFDVQHGIIHPDKPNYLMDRIPENNLIKNNINLLLTGNAYQKLLIGNDSTSFFKCHTFVIGSYINYDVAKHITFNNNILVTLQFTHDHTADENKIFLNVLDKIIRSANKKNTFYLKHHPRFNNDVNLDDLLSLSNVNVSSSDINECFEICSLHLTNYSTSVFEAALIGIPTLIMNPLDKYNFFHKYFTYSKRYNINDFESDEFYLNESILVQQWARSYYSNYDEEIFIKLLK